MGIEWREHRGVRYLSSDYRGLDAAEQLAQLADQVTEVTLAPDGVRLLVDVRGVQPGPDWMGTLKRASADVFGPRGAVVALLGIDGIKAVMLRGLNAVGRGGTAWPFRTEAEALDFLASGATRPGRLGRPAAG